ncbi:MAG: hypothetical protein M0Q53_06930 [Prolixibacteraceae bacterium]|jgi:hypothetical protein|nr:hypothetical protein [Prolixibacteraceae bacterium]
MKSFKIYILFLFFSLPISVSFAQNTLNSSEFLSPPNSTKVNTWWHWISGNITKDGITKDLESMKQQGVSQATILNIGDQTTWFNPKTYVPVPIKFNSDDWYKMFQWALKEANRLDIKIGVQNCDGWSTSGGPWISPELSMKKYTWSKSIFDGGQVLNTQLPQPAAVNNFYRDVAVVAYPIDEKQNSIQKPRVNIDINKVSTGAKLNDGNPNSKIAINKGDLINFTFETDVDACKISLFRTVVFTWGNLDKVISQFVLSSSVDGKVYTKISELEFAGVNKINTLTFPATKAKYFQIECKKGNNEVAELEILRANEMPAYSPQVSFLLEKTAFLTPARENAFDTPLKNNGCGIAENSIIDLSGYMSPDGILKWKAPKGRWQIIRFGYTTTGVTNSPATSEGIGLEVDKMDTTALNIHFNSFAGKLLQSAGAFKGNTFKFLLIDSWECEFQNWTKNFPEEFKNRRGYNILPWIPVLCGDFVGTPQLSDAFIHDFRKTIADLIDQNYYKQFSKLCHRNQLELHAEVVYGNNAMYPPLDILKSNSHIDLPMTEFWANPNSNGIPEYAPEIRPTVYFPPYAALADKKQIIGSEAYTGYADYSDSPANLKPFGDAAYCSGINQMILHSYVHQPLDKKPGATLSGFGSTFNRNNPWWEYAQGWMTYQARVQYVLQKGEPVVDVLFYVGDQFPQYYSFSKSIVNDLPYGFQANACNFDMLTDAKVNGGKLSFGGLQTFPILTLPGLTIMDFVTLKRIAELVKEGVVVLGPKPLEMLSVSDIKTRTAEFNQLANSLWGNSTENQYGKGKVISGKSIGEVLKQLKVVPDFTTNMHDPKEIMFIHKKLGDTDAYFVFNQQARSLNRELIFRIVGKTPEIWNSENGSITKPAIYSIEKNQTRIPVSFKPHESKIFVFRNGAPDHFITKVSLEGKPIFPQQQLADTTLAIPQASFSKSKFGFTSNLSGEYSFTINDNRIVKTNLVQTKIEPIDDFKATIEFFPISDEVIQPVEITKLKSLTEFEDPAIRYFAGKAKYTIRFNAPAVFLSKTDSVVLGLGNIDATAEVRLNGKLLAFAWMPNTELVVSGLLQVENKLEITVADVCRNRFIGDWNQFGMIQSIWSTSNALKKEMSLKPSGLMGPLKLVKYNTNWL